MENRVAIIGIFVEDSTQASAINEILHQFQEFIVGRMGLPYKSRNIGVISIIMDAPNDKISALSGKLGMLDGVLVKSMYAKLPS